MSSTRFLNVDLDIFSEGDLQPLVQHFGRKVDVLYIGRERGQYAAHLEVAGMVRNPDSAIRAFCRLIEKLPGSGRADWDTATVRSFSIGIQAGSRPNVRDFRIREETIRAASAIGAQIVVTVYAPTPQTPPKKRATS